MLNRASTNISRTRRNVPTLWRDQTESCQTRGIFRCYPTLLLVTNNTIMVAVTNPITIIIACLTKIKITICVTLYLKKLPCSCVLWLYFKCSHCDYRQPCRIYCLSDNNDNHHIYYALFLILIMLVVSKFSHFWAQ